DTTSAAFVVLTPSKGATPTLRADLVDRLAALAPTATAHALSVSQTAKTLKQTDRNVIICAPAGTTDIALTAARDYPDVIDAIVLIDPEPAKTQSPFALFSGLAMLSSLGLAMTRQLRSKHTPSTERNRAVKQPTLLLSYNHITTKRTAYTHRLQTELGGLVELAGLDQSPGAKGDQETDRIAAFAKSVLASKKKSRRSAIARSQAKKKCAA
ncbi:MAG: hypothetical protein AAFO75_03655, partial [Pseudomonadota bacterium]